MNSEKHPIRSFLTDIVRRNWPAMVLGALLSLLAAVATMGLLSLSSWFLAASAYAGMNTATAKAFNFFLPSIGVRLFAMTRTLARYGERIVSHDATFRILETLRVGCYHRIEPLVPAPLSRLHSADLLSRIVTDIDTLDHLYLRVLSPTLVALCVTGLLAGFTAIFNATIALHATAIFLFAGVVLPVAADRMASSAASRLNRNIARLRTHVADGLNGLATLLTCDAHAAWLKRLEDRHQDLLQSQGKLSEVTGITTALLLLAGGMAVTGTLYFGVAAHHAGSLSGPHLALIVLAVMAGFEAVSPLPNAYQFMGQTRNAAARLLEVTQAEPAVRFPAAFDQLPGQCPIEFRAVGFGYAGSRQAVVEDISFHIPQGHKTAIMGSSGAGKSTLLYLLARFEDPSRGRIRLAGRPLADFSEEQLRAAVCIIDQRAHIFNGTLRHNLLLVNPDAGDADLMAAMSVVRLDRFVAQLPRGLDTWVGEAGRMLSGGQARRLSVARAVLSPSPIWALDEPTEGLDADTADAMLDLLLTQGREKTVIMITHRAEAVWRMDQVILLQKGGLMAVDTPKRLKAENEFFRQLMRGR